MIKFFRHIRQRLVIENKFSKPASPARPNGLSGRAGRYLLYATGEIVLVVIGILIPENLTPTLKGGFSNIEQLRVDIPLGIEGERKGIIQSI